MRKVSHAFLLMAISLTFTGINCQSKKNKTKSTAELQVLVESFNDECLKRGLTIDISPESLQVGFGTIETKAGSCKPNSNPKTITIDSLTWKHLSNQQKEVLMYHELAHCLINAKHNNDTLPFGECKSWMRENDSNCTINMVNKEWREYYINELFRQAELPAPGWYNIDEKADLVKSDKRGTVKIVQNKSSVLQFDSAFFNSRSDWMIKIKFLEPEEVNGSVGITINEYSILLSVYTNHAASDTLFSRAIMLNQYKFHSDKNILRWDILKSNGEKKEVSVKKKGKVLFIFFGEELRSCIPIAENLITIHGYSGFKDENAYTIKAFKL